MARPGRLVRDQGYTVLPLALGVCIAMVTLTWALALGLVDVAAARP